MYICSLFDKHASLIRNSLLKRLMIDFFCEGKTSLKKLTEDSLHKENEKQFTDFKAVKLYRRCCQSLSPCNFVSNFTIRIHYFYILSVPSAVSKRNQNICQHKHILPFEIRIGITKD